MFEYKNEGINPLFVSSSPKRFRMVADIVSGSVLDVGCGFGGLNYFLKNCEYTGIDNTEWVAKQGVNNHCDIMSYDNIHDWVVALGIIETCDDPQLLINKMLSLSRDGIVISFHTSARSPFKTYSESTISSLMKGVKFLPIDSSGHILAIKNKDFLQ